jgi:hypothetical protein
MEALSCAGIKTQRRGAENAEENKWIIAAAKAENVRDAVLIGLRPAERFTSE